MAFNFTIHNQFIALRKLMSLTAKGSLPDQVKQDDQGENQLIHIYLKVTIGRKSKFCRSHYYLKSTIIHMTDTSEFQHAL